jgi:hypothetical protein
LKPNPKIGLLFPNLFFYKKNIKKKKRVKILVTHGLGPNPNWLCVNSMHFPFSFLFFFEFSSISSKKKVQFVKIKEAKR